MAYFKGLRKNYEKPEPGIELVTFGIRTLVGPTLQDSICLHKHKCRQNVLRRLIDMIPPC